MPNVLRKPSHIFGREREWEALADFAADPRPEATLGIVSGRRRQGKTYLLRSLAAATSGFFFEAAEATEAESLRMFGAALARQAGSPADFTFPGALLRALLWKGGNTVRESWAATRAIANGEIDAFCLKGHGACPCSVQQ